MNVGAANESRPETGAAADALRSFGTLVLATLVLAALHELGLRVLDRVHVVERLLSPNGLDGLVLPIAAVLVLVLRLFLFLVAPGLLVASTLRLVHACVRPRSMPP